MFFEPSVDGDMLQDGHCDSYQMADADDSAYQINFRCAEWYYECGDCSLDPDYVTIIIKNPGAFYTHQDILVAKSEISPETVVFRTFVFSIFSKVLNTFPYDVGLVSAYLLGLKTSYLRYYTI